MNTIHLLPTDKPSRLCYVICTEKSTLTLFEDEMEKDKRFFPQHIYITSNEEIKEGDWTFDGKKPYKWTSGDVEDCLYNLGANKYKGCKKIILTTDPQLIADGVQAIDDDFLHWFVKNPSCKDVDTSWYTVSDKRVYKIIIPKEESKQDIIQSNEDAEIFIENIINPAEPNEALKKAKQRYSKQETLEEAAESWLKSKTLLKTSQAPGLLIGFIEGAKWQAERMYSEEEVMDIINSFEKLCYKYQSNKDWFPAKKSEWFEQFKKK